MTKIDLIANPPTDEEIDIANKAGAFDADSQCIAIRAIREYKEKKNQNIIKLQTATLTLLQAQSWACKVVHAVLEQLNKTNNTQTEVSTITEQTVAGALFDFLGFLTTSDTKRTFSTNDDANVAVEALTKFAKMRGLNLSEADVQNWRDKLHDTMYANTDAETKAAQTQVVPEGWRLMPEKLTPEMEDVLEFGRKQTNHNTYLNLLRVAPPPAQHPSQAADPLTELVRTAPKKISLLVSDDLDAHDKPFPDASEDIVWCDGSMGYVGEVEYIRADLSTTLATNAPVVPDNCVVVPREPTTDMFVSGMEADCAGRPSVDDERHVRCIWNAMIAAAPANGGQE